MVRRFEDESGGILVLTALVLTVLMGMAALVVDVGVLYVDRLRLSEAVDAAALAGVQELPESSFTAQYVAKRYAEKNGVSSQWLDVRVAADRSAIEVLAQRPVNLYFARVLGLNQAVVGARSKAIVGGARAFGGGAAPFGVQDQNFVFGTQYFIKYGAGTGGGPYRGNFQPLALGAPGAKQYENNIVDGFQGRLQVGDLVDTEPGNMAGPTARGIRTRLSGDGRDCSWETVSPGCRRAVIVPVIDQLGNGRSKVKITGFAAFYLEGTARRGIDNYVLGRFIRMATDAEVGQGGDYGLKAYRLVE